jgi:two-component system, NarL family, nitrate/nitrite response regulator NarL
VVHDSDWGRLASAWRMAGVAAPLVAGATLQYASRHHLQPSASPAEKPLVLVLWDDEASTFAASALVGSAALPASSFAFEIAEPTAEHPLERSLEEREPRLLLIDVDTCEQLGVGELRRLRRLCPEVDWLLAWEKPSPRWLQVLIASEAKGCIERSSGVELLQRAVAAVLRGELWFPRAVSQWLYTALLQSPPAASELRGVPPSSTALSAREAEVMALMRRGFSNKQIGERLQISVNTVKKHVSHALEKRGLHKRRQAFD